MEDCETGRLLAEEAFKYTDVVPLLQGLTSSNETVRTSCADWFASLTYAPQVDSSTPAGRAACRAARRHGERMLETVALYKANGQCPSLLAYKILGAHQ